MERKSQNSRKSTSYKGAASKKVALKKSALKRATSLKKAAKKGNLAGRKMRNVSKYVVVKDAEYVRDNVLQISFSNGSVRQVDFSGFFAKNDIPYLAKYKSASNFKKFKIEDGNVVWGKDWDLIFPINQLYNGAIE